MINIIHERMWLRQVKRKGTKETRAVSAKGEESLSLHACLPLASGCQSELKFIRFPQLKREGDSS